MMSKEQILKAYLREYGALKRYAEALRPEIEELTEHRSIITTKDERKGHVYELQRILHGMYRREFPDLRTKVFSTDRIEYAIFVYLTPTQTQQEEYK